LHGELLLITEVASGCQRTRIGRLGILPECEAGANNKSKCQKERVTHYREPPEATPPLGYELRFARCVYTYLNTVTLVSRSDKNAFDTVGL
jgi:hypothetical protein